MATILTVKSGNWSDPTVWNLNRIPQNLDDVIISNGHTIIYDYWMNDNDFPKGLNSLSINGNSQLTVLKASRETNTRLKLYGIVYGLNRNYSIFDWGRENDYIPINVQAEIVKNRAGIYINGNSLQVFLYGADPGVWETQAVQSSLSGSNIIYVDVSNGFSVSPGDKIFIEVEYRGYYNCIKTVQSFDSQTGKIILDSSLPYAVEVGNYVLKLTRNLKLIDLLNSFDSTSFLFRMNYIVISEFTKMGNFYFNGWRFFHESNNIIFSKVSIIAKATDLVSFNTGRNISVLNSYLIGGFSLNQNLFLKDSYILREVCRTSNVYIENCKILNFGHFIYGGFVYIKDKNLLCRNGTVLFDETYGWSSLNSKNFVVEKTNYFTSKINGNFVFHSDNNNLYNLIFSFNDFIKVYEGSYILLKGINSNKFLVLNRYGKAYLDFNIRKNYNYSLKFELIWNNSGTENSYMYLDFPLTASGDYTISVYAQRDSNNINAKIQLIDEETDTVVKESNLLTDINSWQKFELNYNFQSGKQYKVRLYAEGLGNVYWDINPNNESYFQNQIEEQLINNVLSQFKCQTLIGKISEIDCNNKKIKVIDNNNYIWTVNFADNIKFYDKKGNEIACADLNINDEVLISGKQIQEYQIDKTHYIRILTPAPKPITYTKYDLRKDYDNPKPGEIKSIEDYFKIVSGITLNEYYFIRNFFNQYAVPCIYL
ncbi:MAG: hypothetical protein QXO40_05545, partial [Candidatus Aenigmatarchaeota archaeon]